MSLRTPWRDNIEAMTMAIVMALLLKGFIVEAYKIPTGSMQPTLIGDEHSGIKDRILVDKLSYSFRAPERWEVAVFTYPLNRAQEFVKRIVGVGPEQLRIRNGDLWNRASDAEEWQILRRPRSVQRAAWKRLDVERPAESSWRVVANGEEWELDGREIRARGDGRAAFRSGNASITDLYLDGYPEKVIPWLSRRNRKSGLQAVGDLRLDGDVLASEDVEWVSVEIAEGLRRYRFEVPGPAAAEDARPSIDVLVSGRWRGERGAASELVPPAGAAGAPYRLRAGRATRFGVQNMDDWVQLEIDGEIVAQTEVEACRDQDSSIAVETRGGETVFEDLMVYRDIYYLDEGSAEVTIPEGHYFMLGDNTQDSSDGREWRLQRYRISPSSGDATDDDLDLDAHVLRGNTRGDENPAIFGHGDPDGPKLRFVDEYGEKHWHRLVDTRRLPPENAPFVPRELIDGRALAVFWPLDPRRELYRVKWVR